MSLSIDGTEIRNATIDGQQVKEITIDGTRVWPLAIEDFEGIDSYDEVLRGTFTGRTEITAKAALAKVRGSTQGMRCYGFIEAYALPGDHDPALEAGREVVFYFKPVNYDNEDQWHFILAPQAAKADPPNWCYRFEYHMDGGSRIVRIDDGNRTVLATENRTDWASRIYPVRFTASTSNGITMRVANRTLTTKDTKYVAPTMGFGFRASAHGTADYDWVGYF